MKLIHGLALLVCACAFPSFASVPAPPVIIGAIGITSPTNGEEVAPSFPLNADASECSAKPVVSMGYSLDSSSDTIVVSGDTITATVNAPAGPHILHVKSWGDKTACVVDVGITVEVLATSVVPTDAVSVNSIQALANWQDQHDTATSGSSTGSTALVSSPSLSGDARQFTSTFTNSGGQRYSDDFGEDTTTTNFFYDGWVYLESPSTDIANIEMDMNQVVSDGDTVIYAFQCDGYSGTWDYSENAGTPDAPEVKWIHSSQLCNPRNWSTNTWHHIQVWYSRDDSGDVTYHTVWFDAQEQDIDATVPSDFTLGWASVLVTNFQIDGVGASGSSAVYLDDLTVSRW